MCIRSWIQLSATKCINKTEFSVEFGRALPRCIRTFQPCLTEDEALKIYQSYVEYNPRQVLESTESCLESIARSQIYATKEPCTKEVDLISELNVGFFQTCPGSP